MKTIFSKTKVYGILAVLLVAFSVSAYAGSKWNDNNTEPVFNGRTATTKTAAYTATFNDDLINVTTSTADLTITLPAISTLATNGLGSKVYKILKTDATAFNVLLAPNGSDTIDGLTGYAVTKQDDFVIVSANSAGASNWKVSYADDVVDTDAATGAVTVGGAMGINSYLMETVTAANVLTSSECGKQIFLNNATGFATTLPVPTPGCAFRITLVTLLSSGNHTIVTNASANIIIGGINELEVDTADDGPYSSVGDLITMVGTVEALGDYVNFISDGTSWYIDGQTNLDGGITIGST